MNLGEFRTAVHRRTGVAMDTAALTELVNQALAGISAEQDWPWLEREVTFATVDGTAGYTPTSGWSRTKQVVINGDDLEHYAGADLSWYGEVGTPRGFRIVADQLVLYPTPNAVHTVTHRYIASEDLLVDDADTPSLPVAYHPAVVEYASWLAMMRTGDSKRAGMFFASWEGWRERMKDSRRRTLRRHRIRVRPGHPLGT